MIFSILILILMIIAPMFIIKSMPAKANEEVSEITNENKDILLDGKNIIKVNITKENRIEEVQIEEYVKSVVSGEMLVSFDDEALKAQAIAARTYIAAKRLRPCNIANGGDVCDTTHCQVYINKDVRLEQWGSNAEEYWNKISNAVDNTKGMVLTYNNELVLYPQFFSTSSGMTENAVDVFSNSVPYLVSTESKGEEIAPKYETEFPFNIPEFVNKINDKYKEASITSENLKNNIEILSRSVAGGIKELRIGKTKVKGLDFRLALGLSSTNFEYVINENEIVFKCKGYGHGVGMSQWGANVMAKSGADYKDILTHYYTGVEISKLTFKE
ncbi:MULTISPECIES: stage II sporulation protein D [unclassified Clostridium]|uniref:stage II sporulation protein D n=1 Tax=unclassified Clostridium TaxID=2614128 RepID=UPI00280B44E3|nr:stage II sporulation protein D [Clostridium sp.]MCI6691492.1 stage II sporulation protein D [Clostridium sp.]MDY2632182.1 stage II sporulation protein D [Clostridium sp.]MDY4251127.1 stage II sporulation protein D [Clostridium sp.]MDY6229220.1 stage II sporulation protein D [Clostridium sp.]